MKAIKWRSYHPVFGPPVLRMYVGDVRVGFVQRSIETQRGEPAQYSFECLLPGLKPDVTKGRVKTEDEAKAKLEHISRRWFALTE